jgi:hypothetical protein
MKRGGRTPERGTVATDAAEPQRPCRRSESALLLSLILSIQPALALAQEASTPARPPHAASGQEEAPIPIATETGVIRMLSNFILSIQPAVALAKEASAPAQPPHAAPHQEDARIPVAEDVGVGFVRMTQQEYDEYVKSMGHLPVMSKEYIFGKKIPLPKTDEAGHIHLSDPAPAVIHKSEPQR